MSARIADRAGRGAIVSGLRDAPPCRRRSRGRARRAGSRDRPAPSAPAKHFARRHRDHVGDPLGREHGGGELGDRLHHVDVRQVLQRAHLVLGERALAADVQHRALGAEGGGDAGHRVGAARARGRHDAAELAGLARIAVGGMGRHLLVADVDDPDALVEAAVVDVDDVAAAQGEDGVHALVLERLGDEPAARDDIGIEALPVQRVRGGRHDWRLSFKSCSFASDVTRLGRSSDRGARGRYPSRCAGRGCGAASCARGPPSRRARHRATRSLR